MFKKIKYGCIFSLLVFFASCYKDKGNYSYREINQISVSSDSSTITIMQQDTLRINIALSQTLPNEAGLSYQWVFYPSSTPLTRRILDSTQNLKALISEAPGSYYLDYFVSDKNTGVSFQKKFTVNVVSAFGEGWLVLEESNGATDLDLIAPGGSIFKNIYSAANAGQKFPSGTFNVSIINTRNDQEIYILSPHDMVQVNYIDFLKINNFNKLFYSAPLPKPEAHFIESSDKRLINDGQVYTISTIVPGPYFYGLPLSGIGEYYMEPYDIFALARGFSYYDRMSQRFYRAGSYDLTFQAFPQYDPAKDSFDMNNVGKKLLYAEKNVTNLHNLLFKNNSDDSLFIYTLNAGLANPAIAKYDVTNAEGLLNADHFRMSRTLNFLYYTTANKVYKLDIYARSSTLLYSFPAGTEVADMQLYYNSKNAADPDNYRLMAIAANEGGEGKVYFFPIAATGNFDNDTYRNVYTGFKQINGITYKNRK